MKRHYHVVSHTGWTHTWP